MIANTALIRITLYRDGRVRLTKAAAAYFNIGSTAELRPGSATEPWWLDLRPDAPQPVSTSRATWQFRSGYRLERVFPHNSPKQKIVLVPAEDPQTTPGLVPLRPAA
ncbi:hypothetical protein [Hymenobacter fodinae]|uniref:Uncharacterized protein n=1 Tax=Hymenobacter fodinae TaxID=2510796 RepID=A0A4Z0P0Q7_9BACT|nr:hypothetical protein [Hymenobacter fodinae]TGE03343.1 hypothetical protein EU556_25850 [Hymenobacter fodinae]